ncbi:MAG: ATP-binding protein [Patulibacter minatonensis]
MKEQAELDFRALFESTPSPLMVLDPGLHLVAVNDAYCAATMIVRESVVGRHLFDVFPQPEDVDHDGQSNLGASLGRVKAFLQPDTMSVQQYDIPRADGTFEERYWSPVNVPVIGDDGQLRWIIHRVEDVTEFVKAGGHGGTEEADILRRSAALRDSNQLLRDSNDAKNDFLSRMSHELRTPLAAVLGFSELLTLSGLPEEQHEWSSAILRAGRHLLDLVNDVLDISRIESGDLALSIEPIAVGPLLTDAYELVAPLAISREVQIHPPTFDVRSGYAVADPQRLKQVVVNLLSNAVKYNRDGGDVRVHVQENDADEQVLLAVSDTGQGIPGNKLARLFVPFDRLDAPATGVEGIGLGLALSRTLVERMGGTLTVDSVEGEGSTFTITLGRGEPVAIDADSEENRDLLVPLPYAGDAKLLYIEDTATNVRLVEQILGARPSVKLLPAMFGSLGLELAQEHRPQLILLDLHLPDIDGGEVLSRLRADDRTKDIPVVILSADATMRQADALIAAGASAYLTKPISVRDLLALVDGVLGAPADAGATSQP